MSLIEAKITTTKNLRNHARMLSKNTDPCQRIAASEWELRLEKEIEELKAERDTDRAEVSTPNQEAATADAR